MMIWRSLSPRTLAAVLQLALQHRSQRRFSADIATGTPGRSGQITGPSGDGKPGMQDRRPQGTAR